MGAIERWTVLREVDDATRGIARERTPITPTEVLKAIIFLKDVVKLACEA